MKIRWYNFEENFPSQTSRKSVLQLKNFFSEEPNIKHHTFTNFESAHPTSKTQNLSAFEKIRLSRECRKLLSSPSMKEEINTELTLESMTDRTSDAKSTEKAKVKKSTRKIHLEKSESFANRRALVSSFLQTNLKEKLQKIEISRFRRSVQTKENDSSFRRKFRFNLETSAPQNENNEEFIRHLTHQLAKRMRVPIPAIQDLTITSGTDVEFTLSSFNDENNVMDSESIYDAVDFLEMKIKTQKLHLTDLNGRLLMTTMEDNSFDFSQVILIVLCITLVMIVVLIFILVYISRRLSSISKAPSDSRNQAYRNVNFGRDSSQSIGKYSYDSGLWLGPGPEPAFTVPDAPYYRPPTVEQIARTPRPITAVRTRLKRNWDVDERALSTIPDDHPRQIIEERSHRH